VPRDDDVGRGIAEHSARFRLTTLGERHKRHSSLTGMVASMKHLDELLADIDAGRCVGIKPVAAAIGISPASLYNAVNRGEISAINIGRRKILTAPTARRLLGRDSPASAEKAIG
jgi:hypothetical protein